MTTRQIILVDLDGVLADFDGATETFLKENHPDIAIAPRKNFYFHEDYLDSAQQVIIKNLHASQYFFQNLSEIPNAVQGWQRIIDLGYEPRICSSPLHSNEWCKAEKLDWVERHLGKQARDTAIITSDKEQASGIALIDDRPVIKHADRAVWQHVVFHQPYNQHIDTPFRLRDWNDKNLATILETAAQMYQQSNT